MNIKNLILATTILLCSGTVAQADPGDHSATCDHHHALPTDPYDRFVAELWDPGLDSPIPTRAIAKAMSLRPDSYTDARHAPVLRAYAHALFREGQFDEAADVFESIAAGDADPETTVNALRARAQLALFAFKDPADAAHRYRAMIDYIERSINPESTSMAIHLAEAYSKLSMALRADGRLEEAIKARSTLLEIDVNPVDAYLIPYALVENARDLASLGETLRASQAFDAAIEAVRSDARRTTGPAFRYDIDSLRYEKLQAAAPGPDHPDRERLTEAFIKDAENPRHPIVYAMRLELARTAIRSGQAEHGLEAIRGIADEIDAMFEQQLETGPVLEGVFAASIVELAAAHGMKREDRQAGALLDLLAFRLPNHPLAADALRTANQLLSDPTSVDH